MDTTLGGFTEHRQKLMSLTGEPKALDVQSNLDASIKDSKVENISGDDKSATDGDTTPKKKKGKKKKGDADKNKDDEEKAAKAKEAEKAEKEAKDKKKKAVAPKHNKKKDAPLKMNKKIELFRNSEGLSQSQKDYESKLWPRHYMPNIMEERMKRFGEIEEAKNKKN